jgi:hypothetical protein
MAIGLFKGLLGRLNHTRQQKLIGHFREFGERGFARSGFQPGEVDIGNKHDARVAAYADLP